MATITVSADNLPKDSGSRYSWAPFDPATSAFKLPYAAAVSGDYGGLAISHMYSAITDTIASGAGTASGVDLGGYGFANLLVPQMTPCQFELQVASAATGGAGVWFNMRNNDGATTAQIFSGLSGTAYSTDLGIRWQPIRYVRISANSAQTAARSFTFLVKS